MACGTLAVTVPGGRDKGRRAERRPYSGRGFAGGDQMEFLQARGARFEAALREFLSGRSMTFRGVNFWRTPDGYLEVRVHPDWRLDRDEEQRRLDEPEFSRRVAAEISAASPLFAAETENLPWRLIKLDPGGTETICLYCPEEGKVIWTFGSS